jgi:hypothetical protein
LTTEEPSDSQEGVFTTELVNYVGRKAVQMKCNFRRTRFDACSNSDVSSLQGLPSTKERLAGLSNQISV